MLTESVNEENTYSSEYVVSLTEDVFGISVWRNFNFDGSNINVAA